VGPRFMLASATIANPVEHVEALTGLDDIALIDTDGSPGGERQIAMWNPPLIEDDDEAERVAERVRAGGGESGGPVAPVPGEARSAASAGDAIDAAHAGRGVVPNGSDDGGPSEEGWPVRPTDNPVDVAPEGLPDRDDPESPQLNPDVELLDASELVVGRTRRSALTEASLMLADLVEAEVRTICFIRSRKGVEVVAQSTIEELQKRDRGDLARSVIGYRAGYTTGQRHHLERRLVDGEVRCVVTTTALELGIDIGELDACVVVTFPGTVASLRQMWGRAGRRGRGLAVYVAGEDALDQYFCRHPDSFLDRPVEAAILHHENEPIHLAHLLCAAYEAPLSDADVPTLGPRWRAYAELLAGRGELRERGGVFRPVLGEGFPAGEVPLRSASNRRVVIVDGETGEEIGHVEHDKAPATVHPGAVYLHLGQEYEVIDLSLEAGYAVVEPFHGTWWTEPKREIEVLFDEILDHREVETAAGAMPLSFGRVTVTDTVLGYQRRKKGSGEVIDLRTVDLPSVSYQTEAVWYEPGSLIHGGGVPGSAVPAEGLTADAAALLPFPTEHVLGALHAAEHGQIAVLPLLAMCDRWDVGGLSTNLHPQTGGPAIIVYEGHVGGVGIARQAFLWFEAWVDDARRLIDECPCESGCPSCVQSPKCGNLNEPLHKAGALELLERVAG
jgi:DEAD/DEAH box helicase domain-containing protein